MLNPGAGKKKLLFGAGLGYDKAALEISGGGYPLNEEIKMEKGYLALVLHAHLPYVRHPEYEEFLEEDWLFEGITETYIPLINVFEGLMRDGVDSRTVGKRR